MRVNQRVAVSHECVCSVLVAIVSVMVKLKFTVPDLYLSTQWADNSDCAAGNFAWYLVQRL